MQRVVRWTSVVLAASLALTTLASARPLHSLTGQAAPDFLQHLMSGPAGNFRLSDHRGEVVLVGFWTSWCQGCAEYVQQLQGYDQTYASAGLVVMAVGLDEKSDTARAFVRPYGSSLRTSDDVPGQIGRAYDVEEVPMSVLIDRDGIVRFVHVNNDHASQVAIQRELRQLLDE